MIGVFDSGSGGLTVLKALTDTFPQHDFLYLGDHARAPYGSKEPQAVYRYSQEAVDYLLKAGCRLIILACNTAAAIALRPMQQTWLPARAPNARVLGVHVPLVEYITQSNWNERPDHPPQPKIEKKAAIFATPATVRSGSFHTEITARTGSVSVYQQACPGLADAIENHADDTVLYDLIKDAITQLSKRVSLNELDFAALACTHYPFTEAQFRALLPKRTQILTQPALVARSLKDYLIRHPEFDEQGSGRVKLLTTGNPARLNGLASRLPESMRHFEKAYGLTHMTNAD